MVLSLWSFRIVYKAEHRTVEGAREMRRITVGSRSADLSSSTDVSI